MYLSGFRWYLNIILLIWLEGMPSGIYFKCAHSRPNTSIIYADVFICNRKVLNHVLTYYMLEVFNSWESYIVVEFSGSFLLLIISLIIPFIILTYDINHIVHFSCWKWQQKLFRYNYIYICITWDIRIQSFICCIDFENSTVRVY